MNKLKATIFFSCFAIVGCSGVNDLEKFKTTTSASTSPDASNDDYSNVVLSSLKPEDVSGRLVHFKASSETVSVNASAEVLSWTSLNNTSLKLNAIEGINKTKTLVEGGKITGIKVLGNSGLDLSQFLYSAPEFGTIFIVTDGYADGSVLKYGNSSNDDESLILKITDSKKLNTVHSTIGGVDAATHGVLADQLLNKNVVAIGFDKGINLKKDIQSYINGFRLAVQFETVQGEPTAFSIVPKKLRISRATGESQLVIREIVIFDSVLNPQQIYRISKALSESHAFSISSTLTEEIVKGVISEATENPSYQQLRAEVLVPKGCISCHSASLKMDGIDLSSYASTVAAVSSTTGTKVVVSGKTTDSSLHTSVAGDSPLMPKSAGSFGGYLNATQVALIDAWINTGLREFPNSAPVGGGSTDGGNEDEDDSGGGSDSGGGTNPSVVTFSDVYYGVFAGKCITCHSSSNKKGGLDLTNKAAIVSGSNSLGVKWVISGSPSTSLIYQEVEGSTPTMPRPASGSTVYPLNATEKKMISDWISGGLN